MRQAATASATSRVRNDLNAFDYGSAIASLGSNFLTKMNTDKPASYREFTQASVTASNPLPRDAALRRLA